MITAGLKTLPPVGEFPQTHELLEQHVVGIRSRKPLPAGILAGLAVAAYAASCRQGRFRSKRRPTAAFSKALARSDTSRHEGVTELVVDGDALSMDFILGAVDHLRSESARVQTTIFAEPGRMNNKAWKDLISRRGFEFKSVRRYGLYEEPNDRAVKQHLRTLATKAGTGRVALLAADDDFVQDMRKIVLTGKEALIFTSSKYYGLAQKYKQAGVLVVPLDPDKKITYKVRAVLQSDGTGFVQHCSPIPHRSLPQEVAVLTEFMSSAGYMPTGSEFLQSCIAKWCFTNSLGPITVYPATSCFLESYRFVTSGLARGARQDVAFFLPLGYANAGKRGRQKAIRDKYGTGLGWSISHAGGPFILTPSSHMAMEALRRLGFLDSHLNSDVSEAMLVFANISTNKRLLRKLEALPEHGERVEQLQHKFEQAFLSSRSSGQWQMPPSDSLLRATFARANRITDASASREEVFAAMQEYSKKTDLPRMKTYNGLAWQILRHMNRKDPSRRLAVEF
ncbi:unnamed protein product [Symbiodinium sp. CCMP2592]|nr:unnamed protein product [Symbiodinium sp. CCMP2592]